MGKGAVGPARPRASECSCPQGRPFALPGTPPGPPSTTPASFLSSQQLREEHSTQARPGVVLELERPQVRVDLEARTSQSAAAARPRCGLLPAYDGAGWGSWATWLTVCSALSPGSSQPLPGQDAAAPSLGPQDGKKSWADASAHAGEWSQNRPSSHPDSTASAPRGPRGGGWVRCPTEGPGRGRPAHGLTGRWNWGLKAFQWSCMDVRAGL